MNFLDEGSEDFLSKKPDSKYFKFSGPHVLSQLLLSAFAAQEQPETMPKQTSVGAFQ